MDFNLLMPQDDRHDMERSLEPAHCGTGTGTGTGAVPHWARVALVTMVLLLAGFGAGTILARVVDLLA